MSQTPELLPLHPDKARLGERIVTIGPKAYSLLVLLVDGGGAVEVEDVCRCVYGEDDGGRVRIDSLCYRLNLKLEEIGTPLRVGVDAERVVLA